MYIKHVPPFMARCAVNLHWETVAGVALISAVNLGLQFLIAHCKKQLHLNGAL